jgi:hypothetical protein
MDYMKPRIRRVRWEWPSGFHIYFWEVTLDADPFDKYTYQITPWVEICLTWKDALYRVELYYRNKR